MKRHCINTIFFFIDLSYRQEFCIDGSSVEVEIVDVSNLPVSSFFFKLFFFLRKILCKQVKEREIEVRCATTPVTQPYPLETVAIKRNNSSGWVSFETLNLNESRKCSNRPSRKYLRIDLSYSRTLRIYYCYERNYWRGSWESNIRIPDEKREDHAPINQRRQCANSLLFPYGKIKKKFSCYLFSRFGCQTNTNSAGRYKRPDNTGQKQRRLRHRLLHCGQGELPCGPGSPNWPSGRLIRRRQQKPYAETFLRKRQQERRRNSCRSRHSNSVSCPSRLAGKQERSRTSTTGQWRTAKKRKKEKSWRKSDRTCCSFP